LSLAAFIASHEAHFHSPADAVTDAATDAAMPNPNGVVGVVVVDSVVAIDLLPNWKPTLIGDGDVFVDRPNEPNEPNSGFDGVVALLLVVDEAVVVAAAVAADVVVVVVVVVVLVVPLVAAAVGARLNLNSGTLPNDVPELFSCSDANGFEDDVVDVAEIADGNEIGALVAAPPAAPAAPATPPVTAVGFGPPGRFALNFLPATRQHTHRKKPVNQHNEKLTKCDER
jgi:hypothetical protein